MLLREAYIHWTITYEELGFLRADVISTSLTFCTGSTILGMLFWDQMRSLSRLPTFTNNDERILIFLEIRIKRGFLKFKLKLKLWRRSAHCRLLRAVQILSSATGRTWRVGVKFLRNIPSVISHSARTNWRQWRYFPRHIKISQRIDILPGSGMHSFYIS